MLYIAYCIAFHNFTVSVILAQYVGAYTKCIQVGALSVSKTPFLESVCVSAIHCAQLCTEIDECNVFTYDDLVKMCRLHQRIDTGNCDLNSKKNGRMTFTKLPVCQADWKWLGNSCYFYDNTMSLSWDDATEYCVSQGGYLAEVTDEAEFQLVDSLITTSVFIGCRLYNGKWQWTTSGKELQLTDSLWTPGEPKRDDCIQIWWVAKFDDVPCYSLVNFLCEKATIFV